MCFFQNCSSQSTEKLPSSFLGRGIFDFFPHLISVNLTELAPIMLTPMARKWKKIVSYKQLNELSANHFIVWLTICKLSLIRLLSNQSLNSFGIAIYNLQTPSTKFFGKRYSTLPQKSRKKNRNSVHGGYYSSLISYQICIATPLL